MSPLSAMMKLSVSSVLTCSGLKKSALTVPDQEDCLRQLKSSSSECFQYLYYCFFLLKIIQLFPEYMDAW
jgi:hypothetical protein